MKLNASRINIFHRKKKKNNKKPAVDEKKIIQSICFFLFFAKFLIHVGRRASANHYADEQGEG